MKEYEEIKLEEVLSLLKVKEFYEKTKSKLIKDIEKTKNEIKKTIEEKEKTITNIINKKEQLKEQEARLEEIIKKENKTKLEPDSSKETKIKQDYENIKEVKEKRITIITKLKKLLNPSKNKKEKARLEEIIKKESNFSKEILEAYKKIKKQNYENKKTNIEELNNKLKQLKITYKTLNLREENLREKGYYLQNQLTKRKEKIILKNDKIIQGEQYTKKELSIYQQLLKKLIQEELIDYKQTQEKSIEEIIKETGLYPTFLIEKYRKELNKDDKTKRKEEIIKQEGGLELIINKIIRKEKPKKEEYQPINKKTLFNKIRNETIKETDLTNYEKIKKEVIKEKEKLTKEIIKQLSKKEITNEVINKYKTIIEKEINKIKTINDLYIINKHKKRINNYEQLIKIRKEWKTAISKAVFNNDKEELKELIINEIIKKTKAHAFNKDEEIIKELIKNFNKQRIKEETIYTRLENLLNPLRNKEEILKKTLEYFAEEWINNNTTNQKTINNNKLIKEIILDYSKTRNNKELIKNYKSLVKNTIRIELKELLKNQKKIKIKEKSVITIGDYLLKQNQLRAEEEKINKELYKKIKEKLRKELTKNPAEELKNEWKTIEEKIKTTGTSDYKKLAKAIGLENLITKEYTAIIGRSSYKSKNLTALKQAILKDYNKIPRIKTEHKPTNKLKSIINTYNYYNLKEITTNKEINKELYNKIRKTIITGDRIVKPLGIELIKKYENKKTNIKNYEKTIINQPEIITSKEYEELMTLMNGYRKLTTKEINNLKAYDESIKNLNEEEKRIIKKWISIESFNEYKIKKITRTKATTNKEKIKKKWLEYYTKH